MLSSPGIGSGLDVQAIVQQLITLEQAPIVRLTEREVSLQASLSGFGQLKSTVAEFQNAMKSLSSSDQFRIFSGQSSNEDVVEVSATSSAAQGVFGIDVQRLAENHRQVSSNSFADSTVTPIGTTGDTMTIQVGGGSFTVEIGDLTLDEVRTAINDADDNSGVTASIITDDTGSYLSLTANETGSSNLITATYSGADPFALTTINEDRDGDLSFTASDLDAVVELENQFTVTRPSNTISDAVSGISLDLKSVGSSTISIDRDIAAVKDNVRGFVNAFNAVVSSLDELKGGVLASDTASLVSFESQFRAVLLEPANGEGVFTNLFEIGVSTKRNGQLEVDDSVLDSAVSENFADVADLFANDFSGFAVRFDNLADELLAADGVFNSREASIERQVSQIQDRRLVLEDRLLIKEERLLLQFSALDGLLTSLNATSDFLTRQLDQLASVGNQ